MSTKIEHDEKLILKEKIMPTESNRVVRKYTLVVNPQSAYTGTNFSGEGSFDFTVPSNCKCRANGSGFDIVLTTTMAAAAPIGSVTTSLGCVANTYDVCANLFTGMSILNGSEQIGSEIKSYYPQLHSYIMRTTKDNVYLDTIGKANEELEPNFMVRAKAMYCPAGTVTLAANGVLTGAGTTFTQFQVGDIMRITGINFLITTITTDTAIVLNGGQVNPLTIGAGAAYYVISSTGKQYGGSNVNEYFHTPALPIFHTREGVDNLLPPGKYRILCQANNNYVTSALEGQVLAGTTLVVGGGAGQIGLSVTDIRFNAEIWEFKDPISYGNSTYMTDHIEMQSNTITGSGDSTFKVNESCDKLSVATQQLNNGTDTRFNPTRFVSDSNNHNSWTSFLVQYAGQIKPRISRTMVALGTTNRLKGMYYDYLIAHDQYNNHIKPMSFDDWVSLGVIFSYKFDKPSGSTGTDVVVSVGKTVTASEKLQLFSHYAEVVTVKYDKSGVQVGTGKYK
jgi:hypothetical protein